MDYSDLTGIYLFKVNSRNTRTTGCESCKWWRSVKCLLLTLNIFHVHAIFGSWETREYTTPCTLTILEKKYTLERWKSASWVRHNSQEIDNNFKGCFSQSFHSVRNILVHCKIQIKMCRLWFKKSNYKSEKISLEFNQKNNDLICQRKSLHLSKIFLKK